MKKTNGKFKVINQKRSVLGGEVLTHMLVEDKSKSVFSICIRYRDEFAHRDISTNLSESERLFHLISGGKVTPLSLNDIIDDYEM